MATELNARDLKLVQYLNEAYGKEKELETALTADITLTTDKTYRKRLQDHLKETRAHSRQLKSRIKALGGKAEEVSLPGPDALSDVATGAANLANRAVAAAKGPGHMLRGTGEAEKQLKNAKSQYWNEFEEIATYTAIETLAETVGDKETAKLARDIRREEERMAKFLERQIPKLTKAVAREEIPAALRNGGRRKRSSSSSRSRSSASSRSSGSSRSRAKSSSGSSTSRSKSSRSRKGGSTSARAKSSRATSARSKSSGARGGSAKRSPSKSSGSSNGRRSSSRTRAKSGSRS